MNTSVRGTSPVSLVTRFARAAVVAGALLVVGGVVVGCQDATQGMFADNARTQGLRLYKEGNYPDAAGAFKNAVRQDPRDYKSFYYLGTSYDALKSYQQAIQAFRASLDTMNNNVEGRRDKTFRLKVIDALAIAIAKSNTRATETASIQSRANGRETGEDFLLLAKIHRYSGDADSAIEAYNRASLLDPKSFPIAKEYGLYLEGLGQSQRAEPLLRRAYQMDAEDVQVADALRRIGVVPGPSLVDTAGAGAN